MKTKKVTFNDKVEVRYYNTTENIEDTNEDDKFSKLKKFTIWFVLSIAIVGLFYVAI